MKPTFLSKLVYEDIAGGKYVRLYLPFSYYSEILGQIIEIPSGFVCDKESVPIIKASSARGGVIHDYFSRKDSVPVVTKREAAALYLEAQVCRDNILDEGWFKRLVRKVKRNTKTLVVRVAFGYFHKFSVLSTLDEIKK